MLTQILQPYENLVFKKMSSIHNEYFSSQTNTGISYPSYVSIYHIHKSSNTIYNSQRTSLFTNKHRKQLTGLQYTVTITLTAEVKIRLKPHTYPLMVSVYALPPKIQISPSQISQHHLQFTIYKQTQESAHYLDYARPNDTKKAITELRLPETICRGL